MDALSLSHSLPSSNFDWATCGYCAKYFGHAGLESTFFHLEPLAVAQGVEAVLGDGSLVKLKSVQISWRRDCD